MDLHAARPLVLEAGESRGRETVFVHRAVRSLYRLIFVFLLLCSALYAGSFHLAGSKWIATMRWLGLLPIGVLIETARRFYNDLYLLGPEAITHFSGRLSLHYAIPSIRYRDIRAIQVKQGIVGRIFNFGTVEISTAAQERTELRLEDIYAPRAVAAFIDRRRGAVDAEVESPVLTPPKAAASRPAGQRAPSTDLGLRS